MGYYSHYVDNIKTAGHKSLFLGIRELEEKDECSRNSLPKITDQPYRFLSNYSIRIYSSGCYYLDDKGRWKSDGMKVKNDLSIFLINLFVYLGRSKNKF
jgi:hypothetical protein